MRARGTLILGILIGASFATNAVASDALGTLTTRSGATLTTAAGTSDVPASTQRYRGGEAVSTSATGDAVLTFDGGSVDLAPSSTVRVDAAPGGYRVHLDQGAARIRFGMGRSFEIIAGSVRASGSGIDPVVAVMAREANGAVLVRSERGALRVRGRDGLAPVEVVAGTARAFDAQSPQGRPPVAAELGGLGGAGRWAAGLTGLAASGATAWGVKELVEDGGDDGDTASPVQ